MITRKKNDDAVSPVVGVMLMLVVTIIIAAVVSGFAGGLAGGTSKPAQLSIKADYSQSTGMTISHMGGDTISTLNTKIYVAPTADFGNYDQLRWEVNTSVVMVAKDGGDRPWFDPTVSYSYGLARTFQPGETAVVVYGNEIEQDQGGTTIPFEPRYINVGETLGQVQPNTYRGGEHPDDSASGYYGFQSPNAIGQRFILSLVDDAGRTIAQTEVQIRP